MAQSSFESWVESTKNTFDGFLIQACQKFDGAAQSQEEFANCNCDTHYNYMDNEHAFKAILIQTISSTK